MPELEPAHGPLRRRLYDIVFLSDTRAGKAFDLALILAILASVAVVMLDSVTSLREPYAGTFLVLEWIFTLFFTAEYVVRLAIVKRPAKYATSFFGIIDVLAVLPTYMSLLVPGAHVLLVVRILRVLRIFRVLKLAHYLNEADQLGRALRASRRKISVFIFTVVIVVTVMGSLMYLVEGGQNGFTSIPKSVYWAVVTLTTVGYGDISPATPLGQTIALIIMVMGYGIIAVPTGIVTSEVVREARLGLVEPTGAPVRAPDALAHPCPACALTDHGPEAFFCRRCGSSLDHADVPLASAD